MRWPERRLAMLEAMGVRLWLPPARQADDGTPGMAVVLPEPPEPAPAAPATAQPLYARIEVPGPAREAVIAPPPALAWTALRETVAACTACPLCESRRQTVFGVGHPEAEWMIVGEAPGEQEDRQGEPFVGKSGQLLDNMLRAIGLTRGPADAERQVYIANTVKCRPPGNRNPEPEELARCEPFLVRQMELVKPRIILAMGRFAAQRLLGSTEPIGRLRGRVHAWHGVPLVVTYHPAYLLRTLSEKARAWEDLCLARATYEALPPASAGPRAGAERSAGGPVG